MKQKRRSLHVVIVNQYALPAGAAGITRHGDLGRELARNGHSVTVIASRFNYLSRSSEPSRAPEEEVDGVTFRWLRTGSYEANDRRRVLSMVAFTLRATCAGLRLRKRPDVVIGSSPQLLAGLSALAIARRFRVPFVFEVRDPWPSALVDLGAIRADGLANRVLERIERALYRSSTRIITVMAHADLRVEEVGEDSRKCVYIPNAAALPPIVGQIPPTLAAQIAEEAASGRDIFIYTGAHGVSNGLHEVLDALELLRAKSPAAYDQIAMFLVGNGPEKRALHRRAEVQQLRHVYFHDAVPKPSVFAAMLCADFVLVHFARAEFKRYGMSANKLFDAMAIGRPVLLATPLLDTPVDLVRCGVRYEPGSAESLAGVLAAAVRIPPEERDAMARRGKAEAELRYSLSVTGRQLEEVLREVVLGSQ